MVHFWWKVEINIQRNLPAVDLSLCTFYWIPSFELQSKWSLKFNVYWSQDYL